MPRETVADVGEFGLLRRLRDRLASPFLGDDAALLPTSPGTYLVATVDVQVDGVHFMREWMTPQQVGRRAVAVSVSDIAAMGGTPAYLLLSLLLPAALEADWVVAMYEGIRDEGSHWGMEVAGGNISRTEGPLAIEVTALGEVDASAALRRTGGRPGDALLVTGDLGRAAAGLRLLRRGSGGSLADAYRTPTPRVREGQALAHTGAVHAAMDLSDGIASDIYRLAEESGVGARIDAAALPISPEVRSAAAEMGIVPLELALRGGEDFELLVAAPPDALETLRRALAATGTPLTRVGELRPAEEGIVLRLPDGSTQPLAGGWDHFARGGRGEEVR